MNYLSYSKIIKENSVPGKDNFRNDITKLLKENKIKIVILDDDPTGIQTVHGCLLLTNWDNKNLSIAFEYKVPFFYIITNSRSLNPEDAENINQDIINSVIKINKLFNYKLIFISRSDSTLRGHFPLEPNTIKSVVKLNNISIKFPVFFIPSFFEAGRFTINNVHYLLENDNLIPVADTEFAKDVVFGYYNSNLLDYIVEKSKSKIEKTSIRSISIADFRYKSIISIIEIINSFKNSEFIVINALDYFYLRKFAVAVLKLLSVTDSSMVFRTSSSFPKALSGIKDKSLLTKKDLIKKEGLGLFIVGSYVNKTTQQIKKLLENKNIKGIEINIEEVIKNSNKLLNKAVVSIKELVRNSITPVIYTSRKEIRLEDKDERLNIGKRISGFLVDIIKNLPFTPTYIVAKGGITSHDILTHGLNIENAMVLGQILNGVPVVMLDKTNKYPNLPYIIFPGNVGTPGSLLTVFNKLN